jgi:class 3 adenylate cyclase
LSFLKSLSIQSKLLLMVLSALIGSIVIVAGIAYYSGKKALEEAAYKQLTTTCASKVVQVQGFYKTVRSQTSNLAGDLTTVEAMKDLTAGFNKFKGIDVKPEWNEKLRAYYREDFLPKLDQVTGKKSIPEAYLPATAESRHVQYLYIAANPDPDARWKLKDAGDGSPFSAAHARYHGVFSKMVRDFNYDNLLLIDQAGDVVYTFTKSPVFGTNLQNGVYSESNAGILFRKLHRTTNADDVVVEDFAPQPSALGKPVGFVGAAVFDGPEQIGVMLLQLPVEDINRVMTDNFGWEKDGLGKTGEAYLVGPDQLMRSRSRLLHEDPAKYYAEIQTAGYAADEIQRVKTYGTATLAQANHTEAVVRALKGETGRLEEKNYRGVMALTCYTPLDLAELHWEGLHWVVVAEMESEEAFAPLKDLTRRILVSSLVMILFMTVAAAAVSKRFVQPIFNVLDGVQRLEKGEKDVLIQSESSDEFRDLGEAFNRMSRNLTKTRDLLVMKIKERDELLDNLLPPAAADRRKRGQTPVPDPYPEISILYAEFLVPVQRGSSLATENSFDTLNELVLALDDAAEQRGVEKLACDGMTYMASSGISRQRLDHASRIVDFAQDVLRIVDWFRREKSADIHVQVGVDSGPAVGGVVGRKQFGYCLAGGTVSLASVLARECPPDEILAGEETHAATKKLYKFDAPVRFAAADGDAVTAWPLRSADRHVVPTEAGQNGQERETGGGEESVRAASGGVGSV